MDERDRKILELLQVDANMPVSRIADVVALSQSACSRRIAALQEAGYILGATARLDRKRLNLPTTIFVLVRTSRHSEDWLRAFHKAVEAIPEVVEVHRLTGNFDYILKIVLPNVEHYDAVYKALIHRVELHDMSAYISMETVKSSDVLPLQYL